MVKTMRFQDIQVAAPGYGAMGLSSMYGQADDAVSEKTLAKALELGCTFWDTAVVYGRGHNEKLLGNFLTKNNARDKVFLASKCGFACLDGEPGLLGVVDNSARHIATYMAGTRERLGFYPDLYYLHRIDPNVPLDISIPALAALKQAGKCRYIGLSECSAETLRKACAIYHIDALQIEYSPWATDHEESGLLDVARELGVTIVAYSPLGRGMLGGKIRSPDDFEPDDVRRHLPRYSAENMPKNLRIVDEFTRLAAKKGCTSSQLALAWVMAQGCIPIPGTRDGERLEENFKAGEVKLSEAELFELRTLVEEAKPHGARLPAQFAKTVGN